MDFHKNLHFAINGIFVWLFGAEIKMETPDMFQYVFHVGRQS